MANLVLTGDGAVVAAAAASAAGIHLYGGLVGVWRQVDARVHHEEVAWPAGTNAKLMQHKDGSKTSRTQNQHELNNVLDETAVSLT